MLTRYAHLQSSGELINAHCERVVSYGSLIGGLGLDVFACLKDGRGSYLIIVSNHAGDTKYKAIYKKRMHLLSSIKWNGRSYPLESHVSNHRQEIDDIKECSDHITVVVPDQS